MGIAYRVYDSLMAAMKKDTKICWTVNRGEGLSPVQSCEGKGRVGGGENNAIEVEYCKFLINREELISA